jgi:hypothetical protein
MLGIGLVLACVLAIRSRLTRSPASQQGRRESQSCHGRAPKVLSRAAVTRWSDAGIADPCGRGGVDSAGGTGPDLSCGLGRRVGGATGTLATPPVEITARRPILAA